jgi:gliding motility-associated-like protein
MLTIISIRLAVFLLFEQRFILTHMRKYLLLLIISIISINGSSQDFSNKGKDFWVGYGYHQVMTGNNGQNMVLYFATEFITNVTVSIPGIGYTQTFINIPANTIFTTPVMPKIGVQDARLMSEGILDKGIHVTSDRAIVAYAHIYNASVSGACVLFPTNTLGKEYYSINYTNNSNSNNANAWFYVVATDTGTTSIEITPSANTIGGWLAGNTYTVNLTQGQIYNVMGQLTGQFGNPITYTGVDLTGSKIKSIASGNGGCKRIAVYSGSGRISLTCTGNQSSSDNYMVQAFPRSAWGKKYLTASTGGSMTNNIYRVCVSDPATVVRINGVVTVLPLQNNFFYEITSTSAPQLIESDLPVVVAQYITSQGACGNGNPGDPEVIYLSPVEQNISRVIFNSNLLVANTPPAHNHLVNVVIPNGGTGISSFRIDGGIPAGAFTTHPQDPSYSYIKIANLSLGQHIIQSDSGFNAIAYGFASAESYGYNAGTNVKDLYQQIGVSTEYGIEPTPSVCSGAPFRFRVSLPYCADSIKWNLSNLPGPPIAPPTIIYSTCTPGSGGPDSTTVVNGKTIFWYSLPSIYNFGIVGTYPVTITTFFPNGECGNSQDIDFDLQVSDPPIPGFTEVIPGCYLEPVQFIETTPQTPKPTYKWYWDFGDGFTSTSKNPQHTYALPGTYTVRFCDITTPGCLSDTISHTVTVPDIPSATVSGTNIVCLNDPSPQTITFTGSAGRAPYEFTYDINGTAQPVVVSNAAGTYTIPVLTNVAGAFTYNLLNVKNVGSTLCTKNLTGQSATVTVNPLPTAAIAGATTVCLNAPSPTVTFTGSGATAPYTFAYTINGVAQAPVVSNALGIATLNALTNVAGPLVYAISLVTDNSSTLCSQSFTNVSTTVTVNDLPTAAISGSATAVCLNAASPSVILTGSGGTAPYTFIYSINGVPQPPVVSNAAGSYTITVPTTVANTFTYAVTSVQEGSANACIRSNITGQSATVIVNPLPTATIAGATTVCLNAPSPAVTFTGSGATAPYTFAYTINGVVQAPVVSNGAGVATLNALTNVAGPLVYAITMVTDNSSTLCNQSFNNVSTTVTVNELPTAAISGSATAVCLNAASPTITLTGSGGTAPYTFVYSINGVPQPAVVSNAAGSYTITVPTTVANTFTYAVTSVQEGSANACTRSNITGQSATVIVNPLPTATIAGATTVCLNAPSPTVTFTGSGATAPYTFAYTINGVAQTPVLSNVAGVATLNALTNIAGPLVYAITTVTDNSSTLCSQLFNNVSTTVTVLPLPTPNFSYTNPSCDTRVITFTDNSVANAGTINNRLWDFGGGNTATGSPVSYIFPGTGSFTVGLTVTTTNGCSNAPVFTRVVTINDRPQAGFTVPEVCISDVAAVFIDTSKIANGVFDPNGYEWDFGDGSPFQFTKDGSHLYTLVGTYTVRHIVTSSLGCKDTTFNDITINGANPVSDFSVTNVTALCANDSVSIINLSSINQGNITKVEIYWDFVGAPATVQVDDFPAPNKVYRHKYPNFQTPPTRPYTIRFLAYSGTLCVHEKSTVITVNAAPRVQFNAMPDACYDAAPYLITQASEIGGVPGTFIYSGPGIVNATGLFNPALAGVGTHIIKYTFTSTAAGCVDTISRAITVLDTASAKFSFNAPVCEGMPSTFKEESTAPAGVILSNTIWNFGDGSPLESHAPGSTFTHTFPGWANYTVTMYNTSAYGCRSTSKVQQVYVSPVPQPSFAFIQPSVCLPNASVSFVNNSSIADGTAITYAWDFGDPASGVLNASSARTPPPHIYSGTGPYTVKLTVTSSLSSCFKEFTDLVDFIHPQPKAAFDFSKPEICIGDDVVFTDLTNGLDGTVVQWNWNFGDGITGTNKQEQHLYSAAKTYDVSLYIVNSLGCNSDTLTQQFTVNSYPVVDAGPDGIVLEGGSFTMKPVVTGNNLQYLWSPATYLNNTNTATPTASNMLDDITYQLVVTARGGCAAPPDFVFVKVLKAPKVPNTFTPNNDGINDFWLIDYLDTYPNCKVQVFTRTGQLVFESKGYKKPWNGTIGGKPLPFDTYYYIIEPENGRKPITGYVTIVK